MPRIRAATALLAIGLALYAGPVRPAAAGGLETPPGQAELIRTLLPSVVNITAHVPPAAAPDPAMAADSTSDAFEVKTASGSGFVIDPAGTILTNWHVVAGAYEVFVTLNDGTRLDAEVVDAARLIDLAILKVKPDHPLQAVTWADSDTVQVGDSVLAIGNPLGIGMSVSGGIVSALHRNISDTPYDDFIQTDAAINHGNSGGPLFNLKGQVIGVDSAIISPTAANAGLGFALPANQATFIIEQLKKYGWIRPGWLGMKIQDVTDEIARAMGLPQARGSVVSWVAPGSPAVAAGLRPGDVIVRFEEDHPADERALLRDISGSPPGRQVTLGIIRAGRSMELPVTLGEWPRMAWEQANAPLRVAPPQWKIPDDLGIRLAPLTDADRNDNNLPLGQTGAVVADVSHGTDVARRGLAPGDIILQVGDTAIDGQAALVGQVTAARSAGHDFAVLLVVAKKKPGSNYPSAKWLAVRIGTGHPHG